LFPNGYQINLLPFSSFMRLYIFVIFFTVWCFSLWFLVWTYCLISGNWNDGSWSVPSVSLRLLSVLGFKSTLIFLRLHTKNWNISTNLILSNSLYYCFLCMIKLKWSLLLWNMWLKALTTLVYLIFHSCHFGSLSSVIPFFSVLAYRLLMEGWSLLKRQKIPSDDRVRFYFISPILLGD
jgi:hypothetical protein